MRIAVLVYGLERIGGIKKHALSLCREYAALGHQVDVWCVEYDPANCYPNLIQGFEVHALRAPRRSGQPSAGLIGYLLTLFAYYKDQLQLSAAIPDKYDVLHPHGNMTSWAAAETKKKYGTPIVWLSNDFIPVASFEGGKPAGILKSAKRSISRLICAPIAAYDRRSVRSIDRIAVLRGLVQAQFKDYYGVDSQVIRAGIDLQAYQNGQRYTCREHYGIKDSTFLILSVCTIMPHRRLEDTILALRELVHQGQDAVYLIVGRASQDPEYAQLLKEEVKTCGLEERVIFAGEIPEQELVDCYHACDVFVWASDEKQTWGLAGMEAMAAARPVIVSNASGLAEVLTDEVDALLVSPRSPQSITTAILRLISDPPFATSLGSHARELVKNNFSWQKNACELLALFEEARAANQFKKTK